MDSYSVTYKVTPNIALIKYWGKSDVNQNFPLFPSLSFTLNHDDICTTTKITYKPELNNTLFLLNGKESEIPNRLKKILNILEIEPIPGLTPRVMSTK